MQKKIVPILILILTYTVSYAQKFVLNSVWRDSTIIVDGNADDWAQPFPYFDSKSKLQYSIINDAQYIYISIKTNDSKAQMKIMRAGLDVSFDIGGKKKATGTIRYPLKSNSKLDINPSPEDMDQQILEKPDVKKMQLDWTMANRDIHTQGLKGIPAVVTEADSSKYGISAAINWDRSEVMTYELKIPFSAFFKDLLSTTDTLKPINITIKAYGMDLPLIPTGSSSPNTSADVTGSAGANGLNSQGMNGGMPNMGNNTNRPQTSSPQPTMAIPKIAADMGLPLIVSMKLKLAYR